MKLNEKVKYLREEKGFTQVGIAEILGMSRGAYSNYEIGKRTPDVYTLKKIADILGVTVDDLLSGEL